MTELRIQRLMLRATDGRSIHALADTRQNTLNNDCAFHVRRANLVLLGVRQPRSFDHARPTLGLAAHICREFCGRGGLGLLSLINKPLGK